jgi:hypothetical protein
VGEERNRFPQPIGVTPVLRKITRVGAAAVQVARDTGHAMWTVLKGEFTSDQTCRIPYPFLLRGAPVTALFIPVAVGKLLAGGLTPGWAFLYMLLPWAALMLIVLPLLRRVRPSVCVHCAHCDACSAGQGVAPTRLYRHLEPGLAAAGWYGSDGGADYCPAHVKIGRALDAEALDYSLDQVRRLIDEGNPDIIRGPGGVAVGVKVQPGTQTGQWLASREPRHAGGLVPEQRSGVDN